MRQTAYIFNFGGTARLFSKAVTTFNISPVVNGCLFLSHIFTESLFVSFIIVALVDGKECVTMVLVYIFLMARDV
jgi:hypothetical protein